MQNASVLLASSDRELIRAVEEAVASTRGFGLAVVDTLEASRRVLEDRGDILVLVAHLVADKDLAVLRRLTQASRSHNPSLVILALGDRHDAAQGLEALRAGVSDYLSRPLDISRLAYLIDVLTVDAQLRPPQARADGEADLALRSLDGASFYYTPNGPMGQLMEMVERLAPLESTVLLEGETGTGKTSLAEAIHRVSPRRDQPFLTIHCGALASSLIESEMFGHVKGAFTSADANRVGKFAEVGRGTLFLDEIDSLPLDLQAKLLRVVEQRLFEPVGSNRTLQMQARLIVASNRLLEHEVKAGRFRSDLYYRLNVISLAIPPLRQQREIVPLLARRFLNQLDARAGRRGLQIGAEALELMLAHSWPGNIRELHNAMERAVALCTGTTITPQDLPPSLGRVAAAPPRPLEPELTPVMPRPGSALPNIPSPMPGLAGVIPPATKLSTSREQAEYQRIYEALFHNNFNRQQAANELGVSRMTLYNKLRKYGLMELS